MSTSDISSDTDNNDISRLDERPVRLPVLIPESKIGSFKTQKISVTPLKRNFHASNFAASAETKTRGKFQYGEFLPMRLPTLGNSQHIEVQEQKQKIKATSGRQTKNKKPIIQKRRTSGDASSSSSNSAVNNVSSAREIPLGENFVSNYPKTRKERQKNGYSNKLQGQKEQYALVPAPPSSLTLSTKPNQKSVQKSFNPIKPRHKNDIDRINRNNKIIERANMDIDKKLAKVNQSFIKYEKQSLTMSSTVKTTVKSVTEDRKNMDILNKNTEISGTKSETDDEEDDDFNADKNNYSRMFDFNGASLLANKNKYKSDQSESDSLVSSLPSESDLPFSLSLEAERYHNKKKRRENRTPTPSKIQENQAEAGDFENLDMSPLMTELSDKAFVGVLKKRQSISKRNMEEMRHKIDSLQHQLDLERKKATSLQSRSKPLYKPKPIVKSTEDDKPRRSRSSALTDFVQSKGGVTGSWSPRLHREFVKLYKRFQGNHEEILDKLKPIANNKRTEDIVEHIKWYEEYNILAREEKQRLRQWDAERKEARDTIYHQSLQRQNAKTHDEQRRQQRLKQVRTEEREKAKSALAHWKMGKHSSDDGNFELNSESLINLNDMQKEMLELAEKIRSIGRPSSTASLLAGDLKPPPKRHRYPSLKFSQEPDYYENELRYASGEGTTNRNSSSRKNSLINHKNNNKKGKNFEGPDGDSTKKKELHEVNDQGDIPRRQYSTVISSANNRSEQDPAGRFAEDTHSHKVRKQAQKYKRLEIQTMKGRPPDRSTEARLWSPSNTHQLILPKKAVPAWRKIT